MSEDDNEYGWLQMIDFEPHMEAYQILLTPKWVKTITDHARPSRALYKIVNDLYLQLRTVEVTAGIPYTFVARLRDFVSTYTADHKRKARNLVSETLIRLSHNVRFPPDPDFERDYAVTCHRVAAECEQMNITPPFSTGQIWASFLRDKGFRLFLWSALRDGYVKAYMNYESFLTDCIAIETHSPNYRKSKYKDYLKDFKDAFGPSTANTCLENNVLSQARTIRDAVAHQRGRCTDEDKRFLEGFETTGDMIHILPHNLIDELRAIERGVREMVTVALKRDAFKNAK